jgi:hypothetical protein
MMNTPQTQRPTVVRFVRANRAPMPQARAYAVRQIAAVRKMAKEFGYAVDAKDGTASSEGRDRCGWQGLAMAA